MASESIAHVASASWAIDSEPIRVRGMIVKYMYVSLTDFDSLSYRSAQIDCFHYDLLPF